MLKSYFYGIESLVFLSRTSSNNISRPNLKNYKLGRSFKFLTKIMGNPFAKRQILDPVKKLFLSY